MHGSCYESWKSYHDGARVEEILGGLVRQGRAHLSVDAVNFGHDDGRARSHREGRRRDGGEPHVAGVGDGVVVRLRLQSPRTHNNVTSYQALQVNSV